MQELSKTFCQINFEQHGRHFCVGVISIHETAGSFQYFNTQETTRNETKYSNNYVVKMKAAKGE